MHSKCYSLQVSASQPHQVANRHCFKITAIHNWNDFPFNVTSLIDSNIFKNRVSVILGVS